MDGWGRGEGFKVTSGIASKNLRRIGEKSKKGFEIMMLICKLKIIYREKKIQNGEKNLVFETNGRQFKITPNGRVL